ncbi:hypothetical protein DLAC_06802 [Tieghemostelium lacteum]|uniref:Uncharacterized protein n=1 Tax=Tieghemostelium lacteum TaxID=361077 RepID=A0A151ZDE6_TIELA|nr:hypothetical protein DLAC_06802 [Tieghemostelium lacteum]|eukprot:KYQ91982.1 hypothetical protein DLAC_06802 [Tieghemostelium lacteum]
MINNSKILIFILCALSLCLNVSATVYNFESTFNTSLLSLPTSNSITGTVKGSITLTPTLASLQLTLNVSMANYDFSSLIIAGLAKPNEDAPSPPNGFQLTLDTCLNSTCSVSYETNNTQIIPLLISLAAKASPTAGTFYLIIMGQPTIAPISIMGPAIGPIGPAGTPVIGIPAITGLAAPAAPSVTTTNLEEILSTSSTSGSAYDLNKKSLRNNFAFTPVTRAQLDIVNQNGNSTSSEEDSSVSFTLSTKSISVFLLIFSIILSILL